MSDNIKAVTFDTDAKDEESVLRKLIAGRGKFGYFQDLSIIQTIKNGGPEFSKIKVLPVKYKTEAQYVAVSKSLDSAVVNQIKEALAKLKASGALDKILSKYQ